MTDKSYEKTKSDKKLEKLSQELKKNLARRKEASS